MKAIVLAAGYATRLYPLTLNFPKALLPINCVPIINIVIKKLEDILSVNEIIIVTNNRFYPDFKSWNREYRFKKKITIVNDKTSSDQDKLGAIADLGFVIKKEKISEDIIVIGADNLFDSRLGNFANQCKKLKKIHVGVFDFKKKSEVTKYGVVRINRSKKIIEFQEKPKSPKTSLVAMCLYYFPKERVNVVNDYLKLGKKKDAVGHYISWLVNQGEAYAYIFNGRWFDIGDKQEYFKANKTFRVEISPEMI